MVFENILLITIGPSIYILYIFHPMKAYYHIGTFYENSRKFIVMINCCNKT